MDRKILYGGRDLSVSGVIESGGRRHKVCLPLPLLVQDGMLFFGCLASKYFEEAEKSKASAPGLRQIGETILNAAAGVVDKSGNELADIRLSVSPLVVTNGHYSSWRRALIDVAMPASSEDKVSFRLTDRSFEVCPQLHWLGDYSCACDFKINSKLSPAHVQALV